MSKKSLVKLLRQNYFIIVVLLTISLVGIISIYKILKPETITIYAKVKLGQGMWWAGGNRPMIWLTNAIRKGDYEKDFLGKKIIEIEDIKYYPYYSTDQYDTFLMLKLLVGKNKKTDNYTFKRSTLGIGSPIELELNSVQVNGSVIDLSTKPFEDILIQKTINLYKRNAYLWEYDSITIGDKYNDGKYDIFEIIDKSATNEPYTGIDNINNTGTGSRNEISSQTRKNIMVQANIKVTEKNGQYILGEEQIIRIGKPFNFSTPQYTFFDYIIGGIK